MLRVSCEKCGATFGNVPESAVGKRGKCKRCGHAFIVTAPEPDPDPLAPVDYVPAETAAPIPVAGESARPCPFCGEPIMAVAKKCKHCKRWLEHGQGESSSARTPTPASEEITPPTPELVKWMTEKEDLRTSLPERLQREEKVAIGVICPDFDILVKQVPLDELGGEKIIARCCSGDNLLLMTTRKIAALYKGEYASIQEDLVKGDGDSDGLGLSTLTSAAGLTLGSGLGLDALATVAKSTVGMLAGGWLGKAFSNMGKGESLAAR